MKLLVFISIQILIPVFSYSDLIPLKDDELNAIKGQGRSVLSYTINDYSAISEDFQLQLGFDSGVPLDFSKLSLVGSNSIGYFSNTRSFTIGSQDDPFTFAFEERNFTDQFGMNHNANVLTFAFPRGTYSNELSADVDSKFNLTTLMSMTHESGNELHTWMSFEGVSLNDSYFNLWVDDSNGLSLSGVLKLHVDRFIGDASNIVTEKPGNDPSGQWIVDNLKLTLPLGNTIYQPLTLEIDENLDFIVEIKAIDLTNAQEFYTNAPKGNLSVDNIVMNGYESGEIEIQGIQLNYLRIKTHDLL